MSVKLTPDAMWRMDVGHAKFTKSELDQGTHSFAFFSTFRDKIWRFSVVCRTGFLKSQNDLLRA